jgi:hypothetical protein
MENPMLNGAKVDRLHTCMLLLLEENLTHIYQLSLHEYMHSSELDIMYDPKSKQTEHITPDLHIIKK